MANEMVERVARAIYDAENGIDGDTIATMIHENFRIEPVSDDKGLPAVMAVCRMAARAAISAMREPTTEMDWVGFRNNRHVNHNACDRPTCIGAVTMPAGKAWRAMIDEALRDP